MKNYSYKNTSTIMCFYFFKKCYLVVMWMQAEGIIINSIFLEDDRFQYED